MLAVSHHRRPDRQFNRSGHNRSKFVSGLGALGLAFVRVLAVAPRRLLLFDIDGTLVRAGPIGGAVFNRAIEAVLGEVPTGRVRMSGKTDPQIVREYLALVRIRRSLPSCLPSSSTCNGNWRTPPTSSATDGTACPGVPELLAALAGDERLHPSVLTGNIAPNAAVKLAAFGLDKWLDLETGAYGSDSENRRDLVP